MTFAANPAYRLTAKTLAVVYIPAVVLLSMTVLTSIVAGLPLAIFSRDPMATLNGHPLTGAQSTVGVLIWCASVAICLFSAAMLQAAGNRTVLARFFACSAAVTLLLALDDLFLVHDDLAERYLRVGEKPVLLVYGALVGSYLLYFRQVILSSHYTLLVLALLFFGGSVGVDFLQGRWLSPLRIFFEDGLKLLGIVSWSAYFIQACFHSVGASAEPLRGLREEGA